MDSPLLKLLFIQHPKISVLKISDEPNHNGISFSPRLTRELHPDPVRLNRATDRVLAVLLQIVEELSCQNEAPWFQSGRLLYLLEHFALEDDRVVLSVADAGDFLVPHFESRGVIVEKAGDVFAH